MAEKRVSTHYNDDDIQILEGLEAVRKDPECILVLLIRADYITYFGKL